jgi:hypothetical protein
MFIDFFNLEAPAILLFHYLASIIFLAIVRELLANHSIIPIKREIGPEEQSRESLPSPSFYSEPFYTGMLTYSSAKAVAAEVQRCKWKKA